MITSFGQDNIVRTALGIIPFSSLMYTWYYIIFFFKVVIYEAVGQCAFASSRKSMSLWFASLSDHGH